MSVNIVKIEDYTKNLVLLLEQYKNSDKLKGLIDSMNDQADDLETALFEIRDLLYVNTAVGSQLDILGIIFNEPRKGRSDDDYRAIIRLKNALALSSGEPESIISILKALYEGTFVTFIPAYPAVPSAYYVITDAVITQKELELISPAGVKPYLAGYLLLEDGYLLLEDGGKLMLVS